MGVDPSAATHQEGRGAAGGCGTDLPLFYGCAEDCGFAVSGCVGVREGTDGAGGEDVESEVDATGGDEKRN